MRHLIPLLFLTACASYATHSDEAADSGSFASTYSGDDDDDGATGRPEGEDDFFTRPPAQTDVFVFIANPDRDTVTRVNVHTQEVRTTQVGNEPTLVLTTPDYRWAVAFNRLDDSVSILEASTLDRVDVPVRDNFNAMKMSPDGAWVVLWHDVASERPDDPPPQGLQSFNEVSLVHVITGAHYPMAVGFNPRDVVFGLDGALAAIVSDSYLATIDLLAETPAPDLIELAPGLVDPPEAEEVVLSGDGSWAFIRQFGADAVLVVDLLDRSVTSLPVGLNPTDLDLSPDGAQAVVVARLSREVWVLDAEDPFAPAKVLPLPGTATLGSIALDPTGQLAVLYTTSGLTDRYATWDRSSDVMTERKLVKPVSSLGITPTGASMLVLHTLADAPGADPTSPFFGHHALTMVSLEDFRSNPLKLPAEPIGFANANNGRFGYFVMDRTPLLEVVDYGTLLHEELTLKSVPVHVGVLPDLDATDGDEPPAWVSQEHDLGRISFYDPDNLTLETITGFELNSEIED